jgi:signal transduction histidine kinase
MSYYVLTGVVLTVDLVALFFLFQQKRSWSVRLFLLIWFGAVVWTISLISIYILVDYYSIIPHWVNYLSKLAFFSGLLIALGLFGFALNFPEKNNSILQNKKILVYILMVLLGVIFIFFFTPLIARDTVIMAGEVKVIYGPLYPLFGIIFLGLILYSIGILVRKFIILKSRIQRAQLKFLLVGITLTALGGLFTNLIYPLITGRSDFSRYGPLFFIFLILFTTYSIFKHHLFNIKMILSELLILGMILIMLVFTILSENWVDFVINLVTLLLFGVGSFMLLRELLNAETRQLKIDRTNAKLRKMIISKDNFLRMISHQLRTPITSINGFMSMMVDTANTKYQMNAKAHKAVVTVYLNTMRLKDTVNDILTVNAITAGRFGVNIHQEVDIYETLYYLVEEKKYFFDHYKTVLNITKKGKDFMVEADYVKLRDVFGDLIENAVFYGKGEVKIKVEDMQDQLKVSIKDNGVGLSESEKHTIWHKCSRTQYAVKQNSTGSGLGLFVAKKIVELHHGRIEVYSEGTNKGSTFVVVLPHHQPKK